MDEFPQKRLIEFRHYPSHIRMVGERLDALEHLLHQPCPEIGHPLLRVPSLYLLEITERGFGKADSHRGGGCYYLRPSRALASARDTSRPASRSASPATTARMKSRSSSAFS